MSLLIYPGSFDPVTVGHMNIIERAASLSGRLIVVVLRNTSRSPVFTMEERLEMLRIATGGMPGVEVDSFGGLLAEYARLRGASAVVRGVRRASDYEYETQMALMNRRINPSMDTIFLPAEPAYAPLSSSLVRDVGMLGGDLTGLVPDAILDRVQQKLRAMI
ncbi:MAG: pantetheine-phosphate adenylyltransferase [Christensenellales bacterium]|jgi:pantetheine-phosphate adenylyltransferase